MAIDILKNLKIAPPSSSGTDILSDMGIPAPKASASAPSDTGVDAGMPPDEHQKLINLILTNPIVNAGIAAGQTVGQALDNLINMSAKYNLGSRAANLASKVGIPGATLARGLLGSAESKLQQRPLKAPQVAEPGALSTKVGEFAGTIPAFELGAGGVGEAVGGLAEAAPAVGGAIKGALESVPGLGKYLPGVATRAAGAAAAAPALSPNQPLKAAAMTAALSPAADMVQALSPILAKPLSVVRTPIRSAKTAVNKVLQHFFSKDASPFIKSKFDAIINDIKGSSSNPTSNQDLFNRISNHYDELTESQKERGDKNAVNNYIIPGSSVGDAYARIPLDTPASKAPFVRTVNSLIKNIKEKTGPVLKTKVFGSDAQQAINALQDLKKNTDIYNVGDVKNLKENINDKLRDQTLNPVLAKALPQLKDQGLFRTMVSEGKGVIPQAKQALKDADERYLNEVVPFKETARNQLSPFWKRKIGIKSIDGLGSEYLKPGAQKDQQELLNNFLKIAPPDNGSTRKLLAYDYLKDVEDDPKAILRKWNKLGQGQKQLLLPEHMGTLEKLSALVKKYPRAFEEYKPSALGNVVKKAAELGTGGALAASGHLGLAAVPFVLPSILSVGARKLFENPDVQETFMNEIAKHGLINRSEVPSGISYLRDMMLALPQHPYEKETK